MPEGIEAGADDEATAGEAALSLDGGAAGNEGAPTSCMETGSTAPSRAVETCTRRFSGAFDSADGVAT